MPTWATGLPQIREGICPVPLPYSLWSDLARHSCGPNYLLHHEEKTRIWALAWACADEARARNPNENGAGAEAVPLQTWADPGWRYQANENGAAGGLTRRNYMMTCLLEDMKKALIKPVNYNKLREVTQGPSENPALFQTRLVEVMRKYTSLDPETLRSWRSGYTCSSIHKPGIPRHKTKITETRARATDPIFCPTWHDL